MQIRGSGYHSLLDNVCDFQEQEPDGWVDLSDDESMVPMIHDPDDILLIVAGGSPGPHTTVVPGWNKSSRTTSIRYRTD